MNYVAETYKEIEKAFSAQAWQHGGLLEVLNTEFPMSFSKKNFNAVEEESAIVQLMGRIEYAKRFTIEKHHYAMLYHSLCHKLVEIEFYFQETLNTTRKCVVFSTDCISMIQLLQRNGMLFAIVHLRSSDVDNLLPLDLLHINMLLSKIAESYEEINALNMKFSIGSLHRYLD